MADVILLCGVPGSGKTWVIKQLKGKFAHVDHDATSTGSKRINTASDIAQACSLIPPGQKIIVDCPFAERLLRRELEEAGHKVKPVFIIESPSVVAERYQRREGKPASKATLTRAETIQERADEWLAVSGTAQEILEYLRGL